MEERLLMPCKDAAASVEWVYSNDGLAAAAETWQECIALDTEFIRTDTFYPMPGLYQIASHDAVYLIDPLAIDEWTPLIDALVNPDLIKVMHACLEDLELLHHHLNVTPNGVFDTQFAQAFLSTDYSLSYAALVDKRLDVHLDKHETRSDWLKRPLSKAQLSYAVEDVQYLIELYRRLSAELEAANRDSWFDQDMRSRSVYDPGDPHLYYLNLKRAWSLAPAELAALRELCAWREHKAREENVPRNRVIWDEHLLTFAAHDELNLGDLQHVLPRGVVRRYADELIQAHAEGRSNDAPTSVPRPLSSAQGKLLKLMRDAARDVAQRLGVAPELLARKRDLEACIRHYRSSQELSPTYQSWRGSLLGDQFLNVLQNKS
jgi:ribonuclease D